MPTLLDGPTSYSVIELGSVNESQPEDSGQGIRRTLAQFFEEISRRGKRLKPPDPPTGQSQPVPQPSMVERLELLEIKEPESVEDRQKRRRQFHSRSDVDYVPYIQPMSKEAWRFKEGIDELRQNGAIVAASCESGPQAPPREKLHPLKFQRIPGWSKRLSH